MLPILVVNYHIMGPNVTLKAKYDEICSGSDFLVFGTELGSHEPQRESMNYRKTTMGKQCSYVSSPHGKPEDPSRAIKLARKHYTIPLIN